MGVSNAIPMQWQHAIETMQWHTQAQKYNAKMQRKNAKTRLDLSLAGCTLINIINSYLDSVI